jgi:hypothetical protein
MTNLARAGLPSTTKLQIDMTMPDISGIPDYPPPFAAGAVWADWENNLWIRQGARQSALGASGPSTYDIVNRKGQLIDRVELPLSLTLVGFGPGMVYLSSREGSGTVLVKYKIR